MFNSTKTNYPLIILTLIKDDNYEVIERKVSTVFDVLSSIGGIMGIAFAAA